MTTKSPKSSSSEEASTPTTMMAQVKMLGDLLTEKYGEYRGDNSIETRRKLVDRMEFLADAYNAELHGNEARIRPPSDSSLQNYLGVYPSYFNQVKQASPIHRHLLAQAAGFKDWNTYLTEYYYPQNMSAAAALSPFPWHQYLSAGLAGLGLMASLPMVLRPGLRMGIPFGWVWVGVLLLVLGLVAGLLSRIPGEKPNLKTKGSVSRWVVKYRSFSGTLVATLLAGLLASLQILQLLVFRPTTFSLKPSDQWIDQPVMIFWETPTGLARIGSLKGEECIRVWFPTGNNGLVVMYPTTGEPYQVGDRLEVPPGLSILSYTLP